MNVTEAKQTNFTVSFETPLEIKNGKKEKENEIDINFWVLFLFMYVITVFVMNPDEIIEMKSCYGAQKVP